MKWIDRIENVLIVLGSAVGLANIKEIFGIVLIGIQIVIVIVKYITKFVHMIKLRKINEAIAEIERAQDELNKLIPKQEIKEEEKNA